MGEEAIPFAMILVPMFIAMGYDAVVGVCVTYCATQIGFGASWMNPFSLAIAQGIAEVPVLSGAGFRIVLWFLFTGIGAGFTMFYAHYDLDRLGRGDEGLLYSGDCFSVLCNGSGVRYHCCNL